MKLSAVLIGKNEEALLARCLGSLKGFDEIIFVDTGSTDKTVEIAKQFTDKTYFFEWNDSFKDARNFAKSKATGDWILSIDCDETLYEVAAVREAAMVGDQRGALAIDVTLVAEDNGEWFYFPRLFKNVSQVFWEGDIHNTVSIVGEKIGDVHIKVGYSPAHQNDPERAFRILKKTVDRNPNDPRSLYYLGREYSYRRDWENCVRMIGKYVQISRFPMEMADAFLCMSRAYWAMGDPQGAVDACIQAVKINPNFKEACLFMADLARKDVNNRHWQSNVRQWESMASTATDEGVMFVRKVD